MSGPVPLGDAFRQTIKSAAMALGRNGRPDIAEAHEHHDVPQAYAMERFIRNCERLGMSQVQIDQAIAKGQATIDRAIAASDSPIERLMLPWLVFQDYGPFDALPAEIHLPKIDESLPLGPVVIVPQMAFVKYRFDFGIIARCGSHTKIIAVECDGKDYHDPRKDRRRDAYAAWCGISTLRATGSRIHRHPSELSERVAEALIEWRRSMSE